MGKGPFKQKPFTFPRIVPNVQESLQVYECLLWITIYQDVCRKSFSHCLITYPSLLHNLPNGLEAVVWPGPDIIPLVNLDLNQPRNVNVNVVIILEQTGGCRPLPACSKLFLKL